MYNRHKLVYRGQILKNAASETQSMSHTVYLASSYNRVLWTDLMPTTNYNSRVKFMQYFQRHRFAVPSDVPMKFVKYTKFKKFRTKTK